MKLTLGPSERLWRPRYGNVGYPIHMVKTTVYLPEDLKQRLEEAARVSGESEARIIRSALEGWLESLAACGHVPNMWAPSTSETLI